MGAWHKGNKQAAVVLHVINILIAETELAHTPRHRGVCGVSVTHYTYAMYATLCFGRRCVFSAFHHIFVLATFSGPLFLAIANLAASLFRWNSLHQI